MLHVSSNRPTVRQQNCVRFQITIFEAVTRCDTSAELTHTRVATSLCRLPSAAAFRRKARKEGRIIYRVPHSLVDHELEYSGENLHPLHPCLRRRAQTYGPIINTMCGSPRSFKVTFIILIYLFHIRLIANTHQFIIFVITISSSIYLFFHSTLKTHVFHKSFLTYNCC